MAKPQIENGHVDIANELADAFAKCYFNAGESRVLWSILRKTYGWHKKFDRISYTQFESLTGMGRQHIANAINSLIRRRIITRIGNNYKLEYGLNKNYDEWESLPIARTNKVRHLLPIEGTTTRKTALPIEGTNEQSLPIEGMKSLPIEGNTKAIKKKTNPPPYKGNITFEEYVEKLRLKFPSLDMEYQLEKFLQYWSEGTRKLQRPKTAFANWCEIAEKRGKEAQHGTYRGNVKRAGTKLPDRNTGYTEPPYDPEVAAWADADRREREAEERANSQKPERQA